MNHPTKVNLQILWIVGISHLIIDTTTAVVPALLPILQYNHGLTYFQLSLVVFVVTVTGSLMQPLIGLIADKKPIPLLLPISSVITGVGLIGLSQASSFYLILFMVGLIGIGAAIFHPEGSRVAYLSAGNRKGLAQSIFQVGGNVGQSLGPLMVILLFIPFGQKGALWFVLFSILMMLGLIRVACWCNQLNVSLSKKNLHSQNVAKQYKALGLLVIFVIMRSWIHFGVVSFLPLYLINDRGTSLAVAEIYAFVFLFAGALGTFLGGYLSDTISKKIILTYSMLVAIPFTLLIPFFEGLIAYVNIFLLGLLVFSSFAVTVVYAHQLVPGKIGLTSGLMLGFGIGAGGIGALLLGIIADFVGIVIVIQLLVIFPLVGFFLSLWLPSDNKQKVEMQVSR
ncbi:MFS transporter [Halalkalibacterium ligniniphilum]|uniref:MFS transporter n=1 Tax=Halalkalibacterium ligniniphilum TaxID=1134413 RepID=UPI00034DE8CF|nr:MFS transporter [Halalkalibacterium ligniniphilum]